MAVPPATINRLLLDLQVVASGGRRLPCRILFGKPARGPDPDDWNSPPRAFSERPNGSCGTSGAGSFIQTLTMVDIATRAERSGGQARGLQPACTSTAPAAAVTFGKTLGKTVTAGEPAFDRAASAEGT